MSVLNNLEEIYTDEDGPAIVFQCRTGKGRTTTAMAIGGLIVCHKKVRLKVQNIRRFFHTGKVKTFTLMGAFQLCTE